MTPNAEIEEIKYMKIVTAGLLLLSLLAGGARAATSANPTNATYTLNAVFTNNPQFQVAYAIGLPKPGSNVFLPGENGFVATDGAGRIDGAQQLTILSPVPTYDVGAYEADVTGTITSTRSNPVIRMTIKGTGFAQDWAGLTPASSSFSMTFQTSTRAEMDWQTNVLTLTNPVVVI
jgi:hypothetical protein